MTLLPTTESNNNMSTLEEIRNELIDQVGSLAGSLGLNGAVGQIYALLYISPEPISLQKIATDCQMSKGNASINIRELERWGAVKRIKRRGDRRDYYQANMNIEQIIFEKLKSGLTRRLNDAESIIQTAETRLSTVNKTTLPDTEKAMLKTYTESLKKIQTMHQKATNAIESLSRLQALLTEK